MKTEPTETDREAARLFDPAPGMRITLTDRLFGGLWARVSVTGEKMAGCYEVGAATWDAWGKEWQRMGAIDTDDPATVGCMLAQVEEVEGYGLPVDIYSVGRGWFKTSCPGEGGPTRGAALVAAMKALRGAA